jgi:DNA-binding NarL/FixJ family response regulator
MKARLLIVDDHGIIRDVLARMMNQQDDLEVVGTAASGNAALELCDTLVPDLIVMDLDLPGLDGVSVSRQIKRDHPEVAILILSVHLEKRFVAETIRAGVQGYVPKHATFDEFLLAVRRILAGEFYLSPLLGTSLVQLIQEGPDEDPVASLTDRERSVFELFVDGSSPKQIAHELGIATKTVYVYGERIRKKLGVDSLPQVVRLGVQRRIREGRLDPSE